MLTHTCFIHTPAVSARGGGSLSGVMVKWRIHFFFIVATILEFLQSLLEDGWTHSTLRVYVAAISLQHAPIGNSTVGRQQLISSFLRGANRMWPPPSEPIAQAALRWLSVTWPHSRHISKMNEKLADFLWHCWYVSYQQSCVMWGMHRLWWLVRTN